MELVTRICLSANLKAFKIGMEPTQIHLVIRLVQNPATGTAQ